MSQIKQFASVKPKQVGIGQYFTLDSSSKIEQLFIDQQLKNTGGDIGGSSGNKDDLKDQQQKHGVTTSFSKSTINKRISD